VCGPGADWCRNILAAGGCTLTHESKDFELTEPQLLSWDQAEPPLSVKKARFWRGFGIEHVLSMKTAPTVQLESGSSSAEHA
jgi:hypothetical protein